MKQIDEQRKAIDLVDREIIRLLNRRIELVMSIRKYKNLQDLPIEDLSREEEIISGLEIGGLDEGFVRNIYQIIFTHSKAKQKQKQEQE